MKRFALISVDRDNLDIVETFYDTKKEALDAIVAEILNLTEYESREDIIAAAEAGEAGFSDTEAWVETNSCGTCTWKIIEFPAKEDPFPIKTAEEILASKNDDNYVEGFVKVHLSVLIDNDLEGFLDAISEALVGSDLLMDITYGVLGIEEGNMLVLKVRGDASTILEDLEEDAAD